MNESRLYSILRLKRGHGSIGVEMLIEQQLIKYNPTLFTAPTGERLAYVIQVGPSPSEGGSKTLMSCHLDTVHGRSYSKTVKSFAAPTEENHVNDIDLNKETGFVHAKGDVLGADDGAGVWLLLEMIDAGVPATYILHFGEECGGIGSSGMAAHHSDFLKQFERAIAFDRKATHSVITHQSMGRCCSETFADELATRLCCDTYFFLPDDGGTFTDTANYTDYIGECTNVSIGYHNEHTSQEKLDLTYLFNLRDKCIALDWDTLPVARKPGEADPEDRFMWGWGRGGSYAGMSQRDYDHEFDYYKGKSSAPMEDVTIEDLWGMEYPEILDLCVINPDRAAQLIVDLLYGEGTSGGMLEDDPVGEIAPPDVWDDTEDDFNGVSRLRLGLM